MWPVIWKGIEMSQGEWSLMSISAKIGGTVFIGDDILSSLKTYIHLTIIYLQISHR